MANRSEVLSYIISEYFEGNLDKAEKASGYSMAKIKAWCNGESNPQKSTIEYFLQIAIVPEFRIVAEYSEFNPEKPVQTQLKNILGAHSNDPGIYAFYDSLGNLLYLGKATKLLAEITSALSRPFHISLPKGVKRPYEVRRDVVRFISAYDVGATQWGDYPKHVESLLLRISKPPLNKNIGSLDYAFKRSGKEA